MPANQPGAVALPIRRNLTLVYVASLAIAALMAAASTAGLLLQTTIYPTDALLESFLPNDVANLLIGLPMLLGSMWYAKKGSLAGLLLWIGALLFVLYGYLIYVFAMPFNAAFVAYLVTVLLSFYALVGLLRGIDGREVLRRLYGVVPERLAGGVLSGFGLLFLGQATFATVSALVGDAPIVRPELALHIADAMISPVWVIGGVLLWRRKAFGYVTGLGLLFQASMLFVGLIIVLLIQPFMTDAPFAPIDVLVVSIMSLVCFIPLGLFIRGVVKNT